MFCYITRQVFISLLPSYVEIILSYSVPNPINIMSIALDFFCFSVPFIMMFFSVLSIAAGVGGFEWPIYAIAVCTDVTFLQFSNNYPNYASVADAMTFLIMLHSTCTGPFLGRMSCIGVLDFVTRKNFLPDLLRASGSEM